MLLLRTRYTIEFRACVLFFAGFFFFLLVMSVCCDISVLPLISSLNSGLGLWSGIATGRMSCFLNKAKRTAESVTPEQRQKDRVKVSSCSDADPDRTITLNQHSAPLQQEQRFSELAQALISWARDWICGIKSHALLTLIKSSSGPGLWELGTHQDYCLWGTSHAHSTVK